MKRPVVFLVATLVSISAHAQSELNAIKEAVAAKQWAQAAAQVARLQGVPGIDRTELRFREGMKAISRNQFDAAAKIFRRILDEQPELLRVRLELARALYLAGKDEAARSEFRRVLAADLPEPVADNVRTFLDRIRARRAQRVDVSLGYVADTDAAVGTRRDSATINGLSYQLSDDSQRPSGSGVDIRARGRYRLSLTERTQLTAWSEFSRKDFTDDRLDDTTIKVGGGTVWSVHRSEVRVSPFYTHRIYANTAHLKQHGVRFEALKKIATRWLIEGTSEWSYQRLVKRAGRNGPLCRVAARARAAVSKNASAYGEMSYLREQGASAFYDSGTWGAVVGASRDSASGVDASAELGVRRQRFYQWQPVFGQARADRKTEAKLQMINRRWKLFGTVPAIAVSHIRVHSTIDAYSSASTLVKFVSEKRF